MSRITKQDTNGVKPLLSTGELGYDNYPTGGDVGRVYVGTGTENIALAKKTEVIGVDGKADAHIARVDNPHNVTKSQVGLSNVENKSSSTIRSEITSSNVTTALGFTPQDVSTALNSSNYKSYSGIICNIWFTSDASQYYTNNQTGFTWLELTFTPSYQNSNFLVIATVNGSANDDASGYIERYNGSSWNIASNMVGSGGLTGSFGDWSITRATEDKQTLQYSAIYIDQPNTSGVVGYRVRNTCENTNGFYTNRSMGWDGGYNSNTSRSTMLVMEIKA